jgi:thiol-disulfide isomerase/thioredoxin
MKKTVQSLFIGLFIITFGSVATFGQCEGEEKEAKLYAVAFHADYCGACKKISPSVMELADQLKDQPVEFIKFDFTSDESKSQAKVKAEKLGLEKVLSGNNGTGFVVLVNADTKEEVGKLTTKHSVADMYSVVTENLR